ncbi:MAG TPA: hypothetical protein VFV19_09420 [Candidatus Polarisedimenticolaceae bacterium]|nr:hypothetical protein [Candidatus Polarisedimenticolaceae bacterium]
MKRALAMIALVAAAARADELKTPPPVVPGEWRATEVPGFVVYGNVDERTLYDVAGNLSRLRAVLAHTAAGLDTGSERPIPVFAFRHSDEFRPYAPAGNKRLDGFFANAYGYRAIALDLTRPGADESIYHELVHHVVRRNFGDVPLWFNEGIATLYETFRCGTSTATVGWVPRSRIVWFDAHPLVAVKKLAVVTTDDPDYNEADRAGTFYLESWLLVHDLLFGHPSRGPELAAYLKLVHDGRKADEALETAFTGGSAGLDAELSSYIKTGSFPYTDISFSDLRVPSPTTARKVGRVEALGALGGLALVARPHDPSSARAHFEAALAEAPGDARARAGLGAVGVLQKRYGEGLRDIELAIEGGADEPALLVLGSRAILDMEHEESGGHIEKGKLPSANVLRARDWLEHAIKAEPFDDAALKIYGLTFLAADDDPAHGIAAFERADAIDPLDDGSLYDLLQLYVRRKDRAKSEALFATRIEPKARPEIVARARETLLRLDYEDAREALDAGDYDRAIVLVHTIRDKTSDEALRARMVELSGKVEAAAAAKKKRATAVSKPKR